MDLLNDLYFVLFLIIALGYLLGRITVAGFSLDVSAVLFVAMFFGHFGYVVPDVLQNIGLTLFIFSIGMQAGPGFFGTFRKQGRNFAVFAAILVGSAAFVTLACTLIFHLEMDIAIGLLTGALTSTPGLAAAIDHTRSPEASIGYGIAYPFGVIGVILFIRLLPKLLRQDPVEAERLYRQEQLDDTPAIIKKNFRVENSQTAGKSLAELGIRRMTQGVVSRIMRDGEAFVPNPDSVLHMGDIIKVVGPEEAMAKVAVLIGSETEVEIPLARKYDVRKILVSNRDVVNMTVKDLNLLGNYNATITRIRRSGIEITPQPHTRILLGDKLTIACDLENLRQVTLLLGNDDRRLSDTDLLPVALGIVLGVLVGQLSISFSDSFTFSPGLTGGVLTTGLVLSNLGKTGPIVWTMSGSANQLLRQLGLLFFLASVGSTAGTQLVSTFQDYGCKLFAIGAMITLLPMILAVFLSRFLGGFNLLTLMGALTGGMTSTPGLAATSSMSDSDAPQIAYATIYPVAMVLLIVCVQGLSYF